MNTSSSDIKRRPPLVSSPVKYTEESHKQAIKTLIIPTITVQERLEIAIKKENFKEPTLRKLAVYAAREVAEKLSPTASLVRTDILPALNIASLYADRKSSFDALHIAYVHTQELIQEQTAIWDMLEEAADKAANEKESGKLSPYIKLESSIHADEALSLLLLMRATNAAVSEYPELSWKLAAQSIGLHAGAKLSRSYVGLAITENTEQDRRIKQFRASKDAYDEAIRGQLEFIISLCL